MNIQRFTASTSREALAKARMAFGEGTLILSNRETEHGVEVVATAEDSLESLERDGGGYKQQAQQRKSDAQGRKGSAPSYKEVASQVEEDADQLSMSTLSFQDYVRERMARRRLEAQSASTAVKAHDLTQDAPVFSAPSRRVSNFAQRAQAAAPQPPRNAPAAPRRAAPSPAPAVRAQAHDFDDEAPAPVQRAAPAPRREPAPQPQAAAPMSQTMNPPMNPAMSPAMSQGIVKELHAMRDMMEDRFNTLSWLGQARQSPIQSTLMLKLIRAGYSPTLARTILERMPESADAQRAVQWVLSVLERNLHAHHQSLPDEGGFFALVGATGVGKTTTVAKIAGQCAQQYGSASVGLISLDTQRVGAQEQLRAHGKALGVVAHAAHDRLALQELLGLLSNKRMVLIDTTGLAPRDPRKREAMDLLDIPHVKRLLVLNAGSHGDMLDDTVSHFKSSQAQQAIFSKIDEAVKLGPAIDAAIRHQLTLRGVTTGQQVPTDWEAANASKLVRASMASGGKSPYDPKMTDLGFIFSHASQAPGVHRFLDA